MKFTTHGSVAAAVVAGVLPAIVSAQSQIYLSNCNSKGVILPNSEGVQLVSRISYPNFTLDFTPSTDGYRPELTMNGIVASLNMGSNFNSQLLSFAQLNHTLEVRDVTNTAATPLFAYINVTTPSSGTTAPGGGNTSVTYTFSRAILDGSAQNANFGSWLDSVVNSASTATLSYGTTGFTTTTINAPVISGALNQAYTFCLNDIAVQNAVAVGTLPGLNKFTGTTITYPTISGADANSITMSFTTTIPYTSPNTFNFGNLFFDFHFNNTIIGNTRVNNVLLSTFGLATNAFTTDVTFPASAITSSDFSAFFSRYIGFNFLRYEPDVTGTYVQPGAQPRENLAPFIQGSQATNGDPSNRAAFVPFIKNINLNQSVVVPQAGFQLIQDPLTVVSWMIEGTTGRDGNILTITNPLPVDLWIQTFSAELHCLGLGTSLAQWSADPDPAVQALGVPGPIVGGQGDSRSSVGQLLPLNFSPVRVPAGNKVQLTAFEFHEWNSNSSPVLYPFFFLKQGTSEDAYFYGNFTVSLGVQNAPQFVINYQQSVKVFGTEP
ncbi:hypothetical protein DFJ73DRAFT_850161 [Zopfochytrium polystomum]|nr:hypothetical protein DFJ73DRAFT_850161 [Zopfochytrium polystomum]